MWTIMILGIETSDILLSVAFVENDQVFAEYNHEIPKQHASLIGDVVDKCGSFLSDNQLASNNFIDDIELIAVATGPGSFTGLRIGLSYAQGLCVGGNIPIIGVNNHQILADNCPYGCNSLFTLIDARRDEVYLAVMTLEDESYFKIKEHNIVLKKNLINDIPEKSILIYKDKNCLDNSIKQSLLTRQISIINSAQYSAALAAMIGWKKYQKYGADKLSDIEPLYIRPFAGVV